MTSKELAAGHVIHDSGELLKLRRKVFAPLKVAAEAYGMRDAILATRNPSLMTAMHRCVDQHRVDSSTNEILE